jgi:hypothetical protein
MKRSMKGFSLVLSGMGRIFFPEYVIPVQRLKAAFRRTPHFITRRVSYLYLGLVISQSFYGFRGYFHIATPPVEIDTTLAYL